MRILLDVDGVLADFLTPCLDIVNELTGWSKTIYDITSWHLFDSLNVPKAAKTEAYRRMKSEGWCLSLKPINGAQEAVRWMRERAEVYFVTSPMNGPHWSYERTEWLVKHFDAHSDHVIHAHSKHICAGDLFIDDKVEHLRRWQDSHPDGIAIKFQGQRPTLEPWDYTIDTWDGFFKHPIRIFDSGISAYRRWKP